MAKKRKTHKRKKGHKKAKGHVPLEILEKRLDKLNAVVKRRGGEHF